MRRCFAREPKNRRMLNLARWKKLRSPPMRKPPPPLGTKVKDSLLRRKYVIPFLLACAILLINQATGINSLIAYNTGHPAAEWTLRLWPRIGATSFSPSSNFLVTIVGMMLVDNKGPEISVHSWHVGNHCLDAGVGLLFIKTESANLDCRDAIQSMVQPDQTLTLPFDAAAARKLLAAKELQWKR